MDSALGEQRRAKLNFPYAHWIRGCTYDDAPEEVQAKMHTMYNCAEEKRRSRIGVFAAHLRALEYIVEHDLHGVAVCEDDATLSSVLPLPTSLPEDGACLLGAVLAHPTNWTKNSTWVKEEAEKEVARFARGTNVIDYSRYRWKGAWAIYYPTPAVAARVLRSVRSCKYYRHFDLLLARLGIPKYLYYPSVFDHDDSGVSQNGQAHGLLRNYLGARR